MSELPTNPSSDECDSRSFPFICPKDRDAWLAWDDANFRTWVPDEPEPRDCVRDEEDVYCAECPYAPMRSRNDIGA